MIVMIPQPEYDDNTSPVSKDSDEISFTRTRLYTPTSSIYSTDSEYEALSEGHHNTSNSNAETAISKVHHNNTRQVTINNTTEPIHGTYALFDSLSLSTTSGPIDVVIKINQDDEPPLDNGEPARGTISSDTGDIKVSFQGNGNNDQHGDGDGNEHGMAMAIPGEYAVDIRTGTGSIEGRIPFTSRISLRTTAGCIRAVLVPVIAVFDVEWFPWVSSILTASGTGSQFVCVAEPVMLSGLGLGLGLDHGHGGIQASHVSAEGSLNIRYPTAWTGWVELRGGSNCVAGEGISRVCSGDGCIRGVKPRQQQQHEQGKRWGSNDMGISLQTRGSAMFTVG